MRSASRVEDAAQGIYNIVNENMFGALRLVSVEQGYDPRDYALIAFGGAGPLHANALVAAARLLAGHHSAGPGRAVRAGRCDDGAARRVLAHLHPHALGRPAPAEIAQHAASSSRRTPRRRSSERESRLRPRCRRSYQVDVRYHGQGLRLTVDVRPRRLEKRGLAGDHASPSTPSTSGCSPSRCRSSTSS